MLSILLGEDPQGLCFVPRLDIWYHCNRARGTLPEAVAHLDLPGVADWLGVGQHSVIPDFVRPTSDEDLIHRGLGFYNHPDFPYRADFSDVDYEVARSDRELAVTYHTGSDPIRARFVWGEAFLATGASIPDILEHPIQSQEDYSRLAEIVSRVRIVPTPERYARYHERIGESGLAVAFTSLAAGPMQHILRDLRRFEDFCLDLHDRPAGMEQLVDVLGQRYDEIVAAAAASSAEGVLFGANYDETLTWPPFFSENIVPWINRAADRCHDAGKLLLTHTDGENQGLLSALRECRIDVADSICPAPMTKVDLATYREELGEKVTIWGGVPSAILIKEACSDDDFKRHMDTLIETMTPYRRLILAIADTTPPDADFDRLLMIRDRCAQL
jgi:uroporphyrinogen-III decarboxylase